jgi:hypothetical protein
LIGERAGGSAGRPGRVGRDRVRSVHRGQGGLCAQVLTSAAASTKVGGAAGVSGESIGGGRRQGALGNVAGQILQSPDLAGYTASRTLNASHPFSMASAATNVESLVCALVPQARHDEALKRDLIDHCNEILSRSNCTLPLLDKELMIQYKVTLARVATRISDTWLIS